MNRGLNLLNQLYAVRYNQYPPGKGGHDACQHVRLSCPRRHLHHHTTVLAPCSMNTGNDFLLVIPKISYPSQVCTTLQEAPLSPVLPIPILL